MLGGGDGDGDSLYNPPDDADTFTWMVDVGRKSNNAQNWSAFSEHIIKVISADSVGLLRQARDWDVEQALSMAGLSDGYKKALCKYLVAKGRPPFKFLLAPTTGMPDEAPEESKKLFRKKFPSQQERPTLGRELGLQKLAQLTFPPHLFDDVICGKDVEMKSKGKHSTEAVANRVYNWAIATWANTHCDAAFAERMEELLLMKWAKLGAWGKDSGYPRPRRWSTIIMNRFSNGREAKVSIAITQHMPVRPGRPPSCCSCSH